MQGHQERRLRTRTTSQPLEGRPFLLIVSLLAVVLLSKTFATSVKTGLSYVGAPDALSGFLVALLILLPEGITALRASWANELQRSINLALGSSLATIGLTVPAVALLIIFLLGPSSSSACPMRRWCSCS